MHVLDHAVDDDDGLHYPLPQTNRALGTVNEMEHTSGGGAHVPQWLGNQADLGHKETVTSWEHRTTATWTREPVHEWEGARRAQHRRRESFGVAHLCERITVGRDMRQSWGHPRLATSRQNPRLEERLSRPPNGHVAKWHAEPVQDCRRSVCEERWF